MTHSTLSFGNKWQKNGQCHEVTNLSWFSTQGQFGEMTSKEHCIIQHFEPFSPPKPLQFSIRV